MKLSPIHVLAFSAFLFSTTVSSMSLGFYLQMIVLEFSDCFSLHSPTKSAPLHRLIHSEYSPNYSNILNSRIQNLRFKTDILEYLAEPTLIITPEEPSHVRAALICSKKMQFALRIRSGGHDYEGISYILPHVSFVMIDLINLRKVRVHPEKGIAKVQAGATLGELYYAIGNKSKIHAFPAGTCPTIGVGGHFSGGGKGFLTRKFGLASDNVIDAVLLRADGQIVNRKTMGEDLFWAIRGGGGGSFGIILEWTIRLVPVPPKVTTFKVYRTLGQGATRLVHRWQQIAHKLDDDLFIRLTLLIQKNPQGGKTVLVVFSSLFLGTTDQLLSVIASSFPELEVKRENCRELSWIESVVDFVDGYPKGETIEVLLDRNHVSKDSFKAKSDFVSKPISEKDLESIWRVMLHGDGGLMIWDPAGGRMSQIAETETPFPHRDGILYSIQYYKRWNRTGSAEEDMKHMKWINRTYDFMEPFVTKDPRRAYVNYRDLDLGVNGNGGYTESRLLWGRKYFNGNFERLAKVKAQVDPENLFSHEQSIPALANFSRHQPSIPPLA